MDRVPTQQHHDYSGLPTYSEEPWLCYGAPFPNPERFAPALLLLLLLLTLELAQFLLQAGLLRLESLDLLVPLAHLWARKGANHRQRLVCWFARPR